MDLADCFILMHITDDFCQKQKHTLKSFGACFNTSLHFVVAVSIFRALGAF